MLPRLLPSPLPAYQVCEASIEPSHPQRLRVSTRSVGKAHPRYHLLQPSRPSPSPPPTEPPLYVVVLDFDDAEKCKVRRPAP